jgi:hypothetical protein
MNHKQIVPISRAKSLDIEDILKLKDSPEWQRQREILARIEAFKEATKKGRI